jgi:polar amino acid transport system permease protein
MLNDRKTPAFGSAPLPATSQRREPSRLAGMDPYWLLFIAAIMLLAAMWIFSPEGFRPIIQFVVGDFFLGDGIYMTLKLTIVSFFFILVVGMVMGLCRVSSILPLKVFSSLYVEIVRGVPVLVWLLWIYFGIPQLLQLMTFLPEWMQKIPPFPAAVAAFTFAYGAYMTEVFRAGIQSISKGQMEASRSLGMNYVQGMRYIVLPQAVRVILPPVGNEFVTLLKDSSLVSILGLEDITRLGREWIARYFTPNATWLVVALLYLILTLFFTRVSNAIERRLSVEKR